MKHLKLLVTIIVVLAITNVFTFTLLLKQDNKLHVNEYPLIDVARDIIPQEHFIVNIQPLREELIRIAKETGNDNISVYFEFLNTGANIQVNNSLSFYPASLVKLPTALVAMKKIEKGEWNMSSRLVLFDEDKDSRYGSLYKEAVGTRFTIRQLLEQLLQQSDNTAHRMLMRNLTERELDALRDAIGLNDLFNEHREVSAKEYSRIFRALYNSSFLKRQYSQQILEWLTKTPFVHTLPSGMPKDTVFAHKIGEDDVERNYLDSGIVYIPNRPYLITVMIKNHDQKKAENIMRQISQAAYEYVSEYEQ
jgi:beta-lactamase class A